MRVGIYNATLPLYPKFTVGGVQSFFEELSIDLGKKGHNIEVINFLDPHHEPLDDFDLSRNVKIRYFPRSFMNSSEKMLNVYRMTESKYEISAILKNCDIVLYYGLKDFHFVTLF